MGAQCLLLCDYETILAVYFSRSKGDKARQKGEPEPDFELDLFGPLFPPHKAGLGSVSWRASARHGLVDHKFPNVLKLFPGFAGISLTSDATGERDRGMLDSVHPVFKPSSLLTLPAWSLV